MNSNQLKFAEIFSFLALIFFIMFIFYAQANQNSSAQNPNKLVVSNQELIATNKTLENNYQSLQKDYNKIKKENQKLERSNASLSQKLSLEKKVNKSNKKFPNQITIPNTGKYEFPFGTATLTRDLSKFIQNEVVPKIKQGFNDSEIKINVIEVIGHTDTVAVSGSSNLDQYLNKVANNPNGGIETLKAGSNADLGLMRALSVIKALEQDKALIQFFQEQGLIKDSQDKKQTIFRAYSAAQLYDSRGKLASSQGESSSSRRIEIRFTYIEP